VVVVGLEVIAVALVGTIAEVLEAGLVQVTVAVVSAVTAALVATPKVLAACAVVVVADEVISERPFVFFLIVFYWHFCSFYWCCSVGH